MKMVIASWHYIIDIFIAMQLPSFYPFLRRKDIFHFDFSIIVFLCAFILQPFLTISKNIVRYAFSFPTMPPLGAFQNF